MVPRVLRWNEKQVRVRSVGYWIITEERSRTKYPGRVSCSEISVVNLWGSRGPRGKIYLKAGTFIYYGAGDTAWPELVILIPS